MKKISVLLIIAVLFFTTACESYIEGYDLSPNDPTEVTPALLLSTIEVSSFATFNGGVNRAASVFTQQLEGTAEQMKDVANYVLLEGDNVNEWNSIYTDCIVECNTLIDLAGDANPYYVGIAKVIKALNLSVATDIWGDVPNREAGLGIQGEAFFSPNYDAQELIYQDMQTMLSEAIELFNKPASDNVILPADEDFIHGGDVAKWKNTAWILKARFANRLSKKDSGGSADKVLEYLGNLDANAADAMAVFGTNSSELNPWYAFNNERGTYIRMGAYYVDLLTSISDPRLPFFCAPDGAGAYTGAAPGSENVDASQTGPVYSSAASPIPLVSLVEAGFLRAEAEFRKGNNGAAATAHNNAIKASVIQITGAADETYFASQASETATSISLAKIMTHKYVALFLQLENYNDWRRTGIPALTPNNGPNVENGGVIPVRFPTPQDERINNPNATVNPDINQNVWWAN
ncbi:MAG: SusD/RagB family nutrient-binding outer membrane lipoprotein [Lentimicrobium sp.]|nr:SusD/RagB family nutrient-binding outer membrane lipoprotein [Lentimicrobium sp.]